MIMDRHLPLPLIMLTLVCAGGISPASAADQPLRTFLSTYCYDCHDSEVTKGDLDLTRLSDDLSQPVAKAAWSQVFEWVEKGRMPPAKKARPETSALTVFLTELEQKLIASDNTDREMNGRSAIRRLNRFEYENTLRDLLALPHLQIADMLPAEGNAFGFDTSAASLDFSHVHAARFMDAADHALLSAVAPMAEKPKSTIKRVMMQDAQSVRKSISGLYVKLIQGENIPLNGMKIDTTYERTKGNFNERQPGEFKDLPPLFDGIAFFLPRKTNLGLSIKPFTIPVDGYYTIRVNGFAVHNKLGELVPTNRPATVGFYTHERTLGYCDLPPYKPTTSKLTVWLEAGEEIIPLIASAATPGKSTIGPKDGSPRYTICDEHGAAFRWFELEGPHITEWPPASHRQLFGSLPISDNRADDQAKKNTKKTSSTATPLSISVKPTNAQADSLRLLREFATRAYRRPLTEADLTVPNRIVNEKLKNGDDFVRAMIAGYRTILSAPDFLLNHHEIGPLTNDALAERLAYFLWNSPPDAELRNANLTNKTIRQQQAERLLRDARSERFITHFLDKWLKLEDISLTEPDENLYPDYNPLLQDSMLQETRAYFREMLEQNLSSRHVVESNFLTINERLATLYGITGVSGNHIRKVTLPPNNHRGGFLTQAALLKVSANGTTTSPVVRGTFMLTHLLGEPPPPPPPGVPAVEPDTEGAITIKDILAKHRQDTACSSCHALIDPPGFALESFDVMGGYRTNYRIAIAGKGERLTLSNGRPAGQERPVYAGLAVDSAATLKTGESFKNITELRAIYARKSDALAKHLAEQLIVYATGAPISMSDRKQVQAILSQTKASDYGLRSIIQAIIDSPLFLNK